MSKQLRQTLLDRLCVAQDARVLHRLAQQGSVFDPLNRVVLFPLGRLLVGVALRFGRPRQVAVVCINDSRVWQVEVEALASRTLQRTQ